MYKLESAVSNTTVSGSSIIVVMLLKFEFVEGEGVGYMEECLKTQPESLSHSLQYLIQQYQDQLSSGVEGSVNVQSLEKSLKDLLSELKQTQTPLVLESDTMDSLTSRPSAQAVNQRVLHHNSELTNFVSRLTEEKMELRNTLGRLEEEIWRYRQRGAEHQVHVFLHCKMAMI
ncbi:A-kinase anchor protein 9 isoform X2 [Magallana gigas]|uniref:A-kinase anchor protein 9 isoform X2 n=1 Tax=Magallana gigas TaxID=29159 RepID=UPI003341BBAE